MPETTRIVINTGPILALIAGLGDLSILNKLYEQVLVPAEVCDEILAGGKSGFGIQQFNKASWLKKRNIKQIIPHFLSNTLDLGEASVIQLALSEKIDIVCIDETVGRRIARLNGLKLTGSIGILIRAQKSGLIADLDSILQRMRKNGIWVSNKVTNLALRQSKEK